MTFASYRYLLPIACFISFLLLVISLASNWLYLNNFGSYDYKISLYSYDLKTNSVSEQGTFSERCPHDTDVCRQITNARGLMISALVFVIVAAIGGILAIRGFIPHRQLGEWGPLGCLFLAGLFSFSAWAVFLSINDDFVPVPEVSLKSDVGMYLSFFVTVLTFASVAALIKAPAPEPCTERSKRFFTGVVV